MKIKTWIKYEESYLPPRCRKLRYRECEDYINVNLKEVTPEEMSLAFEDNSYSGKGKIYFYKGKLWSKAKMPNKSIVKELQERGFEIKSALDYLVYCNANCSSYFNFAFDREYYGKDTSRIATIKQARKEMKEYILVDGELYTLSAEPRYVVNTFGLGHNHGGTGMFCEYHYNPNIGKSNYFSALDGEKAVAYANKVAAGRGDTKDVGKFKPFIIVHMPEIVKVKPSKQHGDGGEFINTMEKLIDNSGSAFEAGLLCMAFAAASGAKSEK